MNRFSRMALLLTVSLTSACATTDAPQVTGNTGRGVEAPTAPAPSVATIPPPSLATPTVAATSPASRAPVASRIKHNHNYVNVRPEPSTDNRPVAVLAGGKRLEVIGEQGDWVKVRWSRGKKELEGWFSSNAIAG